LSPRIVPNIFPYDLPLSRGTRNTTGDSSVPDEISDDNKTSNFMAATPVNKLPLSGAARNTAGDSSAVSDEICNTNKNNNSTANGSISCKGKQKK
jgi:hypothetical protein